jgi:hypothetical protein
LISLLSFRAGFGSLWHFPRITYACFASVVCLTYACFASALYLFVIVGALQEDPLVVTLGNKNGIDCWNRALSTMTKEEGAVVTCQPEFAKTAPPGAKVDLIMPGQAVKYDLFLVDFDV